MQTIKAHEIVRIDKFLSGHYSIDGVTRKGCLTIYTDGTVRGTYDIPVTPAHGRWIDVYGFTATPTDIKTFVNDH